MTHYSIPTPGTPTADAYGIRDRLLAGERVDYAEMEELDDLDFREVVRPIAVDDGDGWTATDE